MVLLAQVHQDHLFWLDALFLQFLGQRRQIQDGRLAAAAHPVGIIHRQTGAAGVCWPHPDATHSPWKV